MKQVALLTIIAGLSVISMATIYASDLGQTQLVLATPNNEGIGMLGHIEFVHLDNSGNIKGYYQTDNFITDMGASCAAVQIFDSSASDIQDCNGVPSDFLYIGLGDADTDTDDTTLEVLVDEMTDPDDTSSRRLDTNGAAIVGGTGQAVVTIATVTPFDFLDSGSNTTNNVYQAGLFDAATTGNVFAMQNTTSNPNPGIDVNDGDQLSVTWTITVG